jgi:hypothetical protein
MTEITLKLTVDELKMIDKYVELKDETQPLFNKIRNAYPKPTTLFDVIRNLGYSIDMCYEIVDAVEEFEKSKEPEEEPEELKTLYQMFYENDWNVRSCDVFCNIVKEWMSQYTHNVMTGEYLKGYEECLTVLEENLK